MMALMGVYQADRLAGAEWVSVQRFWVSLLGELKPALRLLCLQSAFSDCVCIFRLIFGFVETAFRPALFQIIGQGRGGQSECQGCGCGGLHESSEKGWFMGGSLLLVNGMKWIIGSRLHRHNESLWN